MDAVGVTLVVVTDGDIDFKKEASLPITAMYGMSFDSDKGQAWTYDTTNLDAWIDDLDSRNLLPTVLNPSTARRHISPAPGPRFPETRVASRILSALE